MRRYRRNGEMQERGGRGAAVPSNRTKFDVIAYGGNSRSLEWYSEGAVPPIPACSFLEWYGEGAVPPTVTHACQKRQL